MNDKLPVTFDGKLVGEASLPDINGISKMTIADETLIKMMRNSTNDVAVSFRSSVPVGGYKSHELQMISVPPRHDKTFIQVDISEASVELDNEWLNPLQSPTGPDTPIQGFFPDELLEKVMGEL